MRQVRKHVVGGGWIALVLGGLSGCGGDTPHDDPQPTRPATVSLDASNASVQEADNPKVRVTVQLDRFAHEAVGVALNIAGSATAGSDYAVSHESVTVPASGASATLEIDVFRDFDEEGDETVEVSLGTITGNAQAGDRSSLTLTIHDGEPAAIDKSPIDPAEAEPGLLPLAYAVTPGAVILAVAAINPTDETLRLVAESSTDFRFQTDVRLIGTAEIGPIDDPLDFFLGNVQVFPVPTTALAPNQVYYVRAYLGEAPSAEEFGPGGPNEFFEGFTTDAEGRVVVWCEAPRRSASGGGDPLFHEQWHLANTGQAAFSDRGGVTGADLRMATTMAAERNGAGVKLAVVDTGLETCHPDLAANADGRGSFNFAYDPLAGLGASPTEPFSFGVLGDHGTSVAGIAAAAANNGLGGRGVAPEVTLVGFNPLEAASGTAFDPEAAFVSALLRSLGGSSSSPDSASVDVFNMSFGLVAPGENSHLEFVRLLRTATTELRSGRGALYVKAAGNDFEACERMHPLHRELGCVAANSDPEQNLPWLIVVGGFNADDVKASYSTVGANLWVVGPSGEDGVQAPAMITTDQAGAHGGYSESPRNRLTSAHPLNPHGDYVSAFAGTSSAAPAVAGSIAVLLGINPELTWRDVKHILASTARMVDPDIPASRAAFQGTPYVAQHAWQTNAAGYAFHNWYGFGAVDVDAAAAMAADHPPDSLGPFVESDWFGPAPAAGLPLDIPDADGLGTTLTVDVTGLSETADIEAVVLEIGVEHTNVFDLGITLRSPAGSANVLNPPLNASLDRLPGLRDWHLLSNAFYGENPNGDWTVHVADIAAEDTGTVTGARLRFYYGEHAQD